MTAEPAARIVRVRAPNPGPMTLEGTNTYVVTVGSCAWIVDPGPDDEVHRERLTDLLRGAEPPPRALAILLTHFHDDHREGATRLSFQLGEVTNSPIVGDSSSSDRSGHPYRAPLSPPLVYAADQGLSPGTRPLRALTPMIPGAQILELPGHTRDSIGIEFEGALMRSAAGDVETAPATVILTGDTVLGRGTSIIAHPEGNLGDYLSTLEALRHRVAAAAGNVILAPGHGEPIVGTRRALDVLDHYSAHRHERLDEIRSALRGGAQTAADIVAVVYPQLSEHGDGEILYRAALRSSRAQLDYLRGRD